MASTTPTKTTRGLMFEVVRAQDAISDDEYRVEAIDHDVDGAVYVAIFSGPEARQRAEEYATFKNAKCQ
jgi:hypothetical protein